jgi:outer membrane protein assembly factor BamB
VEGNELWRRPLGKVNHIFGYGQSPVLHGDLCYLNFGPGEREFAVAVNKRTGEIVWQRDAPRSDDVPEDGKDIYGMWSTPIVADGAIVFCFRDSVIGFDPETGEQIWTCHGLGPQMKASPVAGEGVVVALGGKDSSSLAVRTGGHGDVTRSHVLWRVDQARSRMGTGVIHEGHLYANRRNGVIECMELKTGNIVWQKRHSGAGSNPNMWSSLTLVDDTIYAINQGSDVFILDASPSYNLISTNTVGEHTNSSVSVSQGNLFIRTHDSLWCIGR